MKALRFVLLIALALFIAYVRYVSPPTGDVSNSPSFASQSSKHPEAMLVPQKALDVLAYVRRTGEAPAGYVGGRVFENREGRLPSDGDYREFDVDPHDGQRNAERLIVEWNSKRAWYTGDHYQTFIPMP
jgi:guanyl-specific ribonuclease Sa